MSGKQRSNLRAECSCEVRKDSVLIKQRTLRVIVSNGDNFDRLIDDLLIARGFIVGDHRGVLCDDILQTFHVHILDDGVQIREKVLLRAIKVVEDLRDLKFPALATG